MKEDFQKFMELVKTDEALQKKLEEAVRNYDGEQTEEAAFHDVLEPIAKEAGFSLSMEDMKQPVQELNLDEMTQVSGGQYTWAGGVGLSRCKSFGGGIGGGGTSGGGVFCIIVGYGHAEIFCATLGGGENEEEMNKNVGLCISSSAKIEF